MHNPARTLTSTQVLVCGAAIVTLLMGIRHGFGLWLLPLTQAHGWSRETFSCAMAIQNLSWGLAGVFAGMVADKFGAVRVLVVGAVLYAAGLIGMAYAASTLWFALSAGVLIGTAQAGTTYAVIYGVIGRNLPAQRRSWAMGIAAAAGSFGQFLMVPTEGFLISHFGHQLGSFVGVSMGGWLYDRSGSYDITWYIAIALGVFAALVNLPVREESIHRGRVAPFPSASGI